MKKTTQFDSKFLYSGVLTSLFFVLMIFHSEQVQSQSVTVTSVAVNNLQASYCTNTSVTVSGMHAYPGYTLLGSSSSVAGFNITIIVNYTQPGVGIPVATPYSQVVNLGLLPVGTYSVTTNGQFNGTTTSTYTSTIVVGSVGCCSADASFTSSANNLMACVGDNIVFTNTSVGSNGTQSWYHNGVFVANTLNYSTPVVFPGTHVFKVVVNGLNCSDSITQTIQVSDYPTIDLGSDSTVCDGDNFALNAGSGRDSIQWSTGDVGQFLPVNSANVYSVVVYKNGCASVDTVNIGMVSSPVIDLGPDSTICDGESFMLNAGAGRDSILWSTGDVVQLISVGMANTYSVVVYENGCASADSFNLAVLALPQIDLGPDSNFCNGDSLLLDAGTGRDSILWSTGDVGQFISVSMSNTYAVLVYENGCASADSINLAVVSLPLVDLGVDTTMCIGDSIVLDASLANANYAWQDNSTAATFIVKDAGLFWVNVTDINGCTGADSIQIDTMTCINTSITDLGVNSNLHIYPNPTQGSINISVPSRVIGSKAEVSIFKLDGSLMYNQQISSLDHTIKLSLTDVSKGIYLLQLATDGEQWISKILIIE